MEGVDSFEDGADDSPEATSGEIEQPLLSAAVELVEDAVVKAVLIHDQNRQVVETEAFPGYGFQQLFQGSAPPGKRDQGVG